MRRFCIRHLPGFVLLAVLGPVLLSAERGAAQTDSNDVPLGDVARSLRKKNPQPEQVIDDDNLSQVMKQVENSRELAGSNGPILQYAMAGESKTFQVSAPDATCSLSFTSNAKALLSSQYAQMQVPASDLSKLTGPATIEGDTLTVSVFNGTEWHVSEVAVAFMLVRRNASRDMSLSGGGSPVANPAFEQSEVRPEKNPDQTVIYRMRAAAPPRAMTVFSAPLNLDIEPGDEWHWAVVEAKGYPPQSHAQEVSQAARNSTSGSSQISPGLLAPLYPEADPVSQNPQ